jgi:general secretion pathway protein J
VELLVVLTLLSLLMLALGGALRGMAQTEQRVDQRLARIDEFRVAVSFLRTTLGHISARKADVPLPSGKLPVMFSGLPQTVAWVGVMPARDGAGGRYFFRLTVEPLTRQKPDGTTTSYGEPSLADTSLTLRFMPYAPGAMLPDWSKAEPLVLAEGIRSIVFEYENARPMPSEWSAEWPLVERLPDSIRMSVATERGDWPMLHVPLRITPASSSSGSGLAVFGGSR